MQWKQNPHIQEISHYCIHHVKDIRHWCCYNHQKMLYELLSHVITSILKCVNTLNKPKTTGVFSWQHFFHLSEHQNPNTHMRHIWAIPKVRMDGDKYRISLKVFTPFDHPRSLSHYVLWKLLQNPRTAEQPCNIFITLARSSK